MAILGASGLLLGLDMLTRDKTIYLIASICTLSFGVPLAIYFCVRWPRAGRNTSKEPAHFAAAAIVRLGLACTLAGGLGIAGSVLVGETSINVFRSILWIVMLLLVILIAVNSVSMCSILERCFRFLDRWRPRFSLRMLLAIPLLLGMALVTWQRWAEPRLTFATHRRELLRDQQVLNSSADVSWFADRRRAMIAALQPLTYGSFRSPIVTHAGLFWSRAASTGVFIVEWLAPTPCVDGVDVLLPSGTVIHVRFNPQLVKQEHEFAFTSSLYAADWPSEFFTITALQDVNVILTAKGERVSNPQKLYVVPPGEEE